MFRVPWNLFRGVGLLRNMFRVPWNLFRDVGLLWNMFVFNGIWRAVGMIRNLFRVQKVASLRSVEYIKIFKIDRDAALKNRNSVKIFEPKKIVDENSNLLWKKRRKYGGLMTFFVLMLLLMALFCKYLHKKTGELWPPPLSAARVIGTRIVCVVGLSELNRFCVCYIQHT